MIEANNFRSRSQNEKQKARKQKRHQRLVALKHEKRQIDKGKGGKVAHMEEQEVVYKEFRVSENSSIIVAHPKPVLSIRNMNHRETMDSIVETSDHPPGYTTTANPYLQIPFGRWTENSNESLICTTNFQIPRFPLHNHTHSPPIQSQMPSHSSERKQQDTVITAVTHRLPCQSPVQRSPPCAPISHRRHSVPHAAKFAMDDNSIRHLGSGGMQFHRAGLLPNANEKATNDELVRDKETKHQKAMGDTSGKEMEAGQEELKEQNETADEEATAKPQESRDRDQHSFSDVQRKAESMYPLNDAQWCSQYGYEILQDLRNKECKRAPNPNYMDRQADINPKMREILVDWMVEVSLKFKFKPQTLFLSIHLLDRFLERRAVTRTKLQLVGCCALLLASKYEEIYSPEVNDFITISDRAYTRDQILAMEGIMLNALGFNLTVPSLIDFLSHFACFTQISQGSSIWHIAMFYMELTLQHYVFLNFPPSMIAASSLFLATATTTFSDMDSVWNVTQSQLIGYSATEIQPCAEEICKVVEAQQNNCSKYRAVYRKYLQNKYSAAAKMVIPNLFKNAEMSTKRKLLF